MKKIAKIFVLILILILSISILTACNLNLPKLPDANNTKQPSKYYVVFTVDGEEYARVKFVANSKAEFPNDPVFENGDKFLGWNYAGTTNAFTKQDLINLISKEKLDSVDNIYVEANHAHVITFDTIFTKTPYTTIEINSKDTITNVTRPTNPTHDICTFINWYEDKAYTKEFDFKNPHKSMTVYAKWNIPDTIFTITLDSETIGKYEPIKGKFFDDISSKKPNISRPGQILKRFYYLDGENKVDFAFDRMIGKNVTVYAEWVTTATINYYNGDKLLKSVTNHPLDTLYKVESVNPGDELYSPDLQFKGWFTEKEFVNEVEPISINVPKIIYNLYGNFETYSFVKNISKYQSTTTDSPLVIKTPNELANVLDYVFTMSIPESNMVHVRNNSGQPIKNLIKDAQDLLTGPNYAAPYTYYENDATLFGFHSDINETTDKIKTQNPEILQQLSSALVPVNSKPRESNFDNFKYNDYPAFYTEISSSNQLFYALEHGYKPTCVPGSFAEKMLNEAKEILKVSVNDTMSEFEKVYAIYCWMVMNVNYDYKALKDEKLNENYSLYAEAWNMEGVFNSRLAVCDGISKAMVVLCRLEGIPCIRIIGDNHAWNKVYIDVDDKGAEYKKAWYSIDATWGDLNVEDSYSVLDLDSFLIKDVDKLDSTNVIKQPLNYKDVEFDANTNLNVYDYLNFVVDGTSNDLNILETKEIEKLARFAHQYANTMTKGSKFTISIKTNIDADLLVKEIVKQILKVNLANSEDLDISHSSTLTTKNPVIVFNVI